MHAVKERPILFSAPMINAILDGRKTQTRRIVKPTKKHAEGVIILDGGTNRRWPYNMFDGSEADGNGMEFPIGCPYGLVGDRIWVRETWSPISENWREAEDLMYEGNNFWYKATYEKDMIAEGLSKEDAKSIVEHDHIINGWRPSIHMPRIASRINLEVTNLRIEMLNDISEKDAIAEGAQFVDFGKDQYGQQKAGWRCDKTPGNYEESLVSAKYAFFNLWEKLNGIDSVEKNPWVWVIEFTKI
ncbi:MAG: hypothetical protein V4501_08310 [Pseudomonadota bacterium]